MSGIFHGWRRKTALLVIVALCASVLVRWYFSLPSADPPPVTRVAVLPFVDVSGADSRADSSSGIADGITTELISRLATIREVQPIARASAFRFRGSGTPTGEIAKKLDVGSIVRGTVRMEGDSLEIRVNLSQPEGDPAATLWSGSYRRPLPEFFNLQSEIAQAIAIALNVTVTADEKRRLGRGGTRNSGALREYLLGRDAQSRGTVASAYTGAGHFGDAIALDPSFAAAYAGLSECRSFAAIRTRSPQARDTAAVEAKEAAGRALKLDSTNAEAHAALALARFRFDWNFRVAGEGLRRAIDLEPGFSRVHEAYGRLLALLGKFDEALGELSTAARLDPISTAPMTSIAGVYYYRREYARSIEEYARAIKADPSDDAAHLGMAMSCVAAVRYREAVESVNEALRFTGETDETMAALGYVYAKRGDRAQAIEILERFRQPAGGADPDPYHAALILRGLDRGEDAISFLERAYLRRDTHLPGIGVDPAWDSSRADPRFSALVKKIGLAD